MSLPDAETDHRVGVATSNPVLPREAVHDADSHVPMAAAGTSSATLQCVPYRLAESLQNAGVNADGVSRFGPIAKLVADSINSDHISRIGWIVFKLLA